MARRVPCVPSPSFASKGFGREMGVRRARRGLCPPHLLGLAPSPGWGTAGAGRAGTAWGGQCRHAAERPRGGTRARWVSDQALGSGRAVGSVLAAEGCRALPSLGAEPGLPRSLLRSTAQGLPPASPHLPPSPARCPLPPGAVGATPREVTAPHSSRTGHPSAGNSDPTQARGQRG